MKKSDKEIQNTSKKKQNNKKVKIPKTKSQKIKLKKQLIFFGISVLVIIVILVLFITIINNKDNNKNSNNNDNKIEEKDNTKEEKKELKVYDITSDARPYAVMIPNDEVAKKRHYGLQKAYLVYEIVAEGGITRFLALFKDANLEKIGPVRSVRHYFLDYALENDALFVHFGWSPQAQSDISTYGVENINGLTYDGTYFWRENISSPNNAYISTENIMDVSEKLDYRTTSNDYQLLNYKNDLDLTKDETYKSAKNVKINYNGTYVKYEYDEEKQYYLRYNNSSRHIDLETEEQIHVKNIIVLKVKNETIPNDSAGRQNLYNIGSGEGYFISNGQSIEITWNKDKRTSKTIYKNKKGEEINVNDGNTFIQLQPIDLSLTIE